MSRVYEHVYALVKCFRYYFPEGRNNIISNIFYIPQYSSTCLGRFRSDSLVYSFLLNSLILDITLSDIVGNILN